MDEIDIGKIQLQIIDRVVALSDCGVSSDLCMEIITKVLWNTEMGVSPLCKKEKEKTQ